jgi:hypothetical protein
MGYCIEGPFALKLMERFPTASWPVCFAGRLGIAPRTRTSCTIPAAMFGRPSYLRVGLR